ncbi:MAG: hypothetical protein HY300_18150 [Verrucomicrobia bacterium]|nr:hypothetical protein [Verrucomicrobiota bacterium]
MTRKHLTLTVTACASLALASFAFAAEKKLPPASDKKGVTYDKDIKPLFEKTCFKCHGAEKQKGKLRLDSLRDTLKGGENGKDVIPGKSADSPLVKAVARVVEDDAMPPTDKGKPLTAEQVGLIRAWIDQGAK